MIDDMYECPEYIATNCVICNKKGKYRTLNKYNYCICSLECKLLCDIKLKEWQEKFNNYFKKGNKWHN